MNDRFLKLSDVQEMLGVSRSTVWRWTAEQGLKVVRVGGVTRIEVRGCDSLPAHLAMAVPAFFTGLLYDARALDQAIELLSPLTLDVVERDRPALIRQGLDACLDVQVSELPLDPLDVGVSERLLCVGGEQLLPIGWSVAGPDYFPTALLYSSCAAARLCAGSALFKATLETALASLDARSRRIIEARWLREKDSATLHELAAEFKVSAERIRQIEAKALAKMKDVMAAA